MNCSNNSTKKIDSNNSIQINILSNSNDINSSKKEYRDIWAVIFTILSICSFVSLTCYHYKYNSNIPFHLDTHSNDIYTFMIIPSISLIATMIITRLLLWIPNIVLIYCKVGNITLNLVMFIIFVTLREYKSLILVASNMISSWFLFLLGNPNLRLWPLLYKHLPKDISFPYLKIIFFFIIELIGLYLIKIIRPIFQDIFQKEGKYLFWMILCIWQMLIRLFLRSFLMIPFMRKYFEIPSPSLPPWSLFSQSLFSPSSFAAHNNNNSSCSPSATFSLKYFSGTLIGASIYYGMRIFILGCLFIQRSDVMERGNEEQTSIITIITSCYIAFTISKCRFWSLLQVIWKNKSLSQAIVNTELDKRFKISLLGRFLSLIAMIVTGSVVYGSGLLAEKEDYLLVGAVSFFISDLIGEFWRAGITVIAAGNVMFKISWLASLDKI